MQEEDKLNKDDDHSCSDDEDDSDNEGNSGVQLGFVEKKVNILFGERDWRNWDGGRIGGKPVWLNPASLPSGRTMSCSKCEEPLRFLLQIYCPTDQPAGGFHRALYLFCCKNRTCLQEGNVKCLRTQLPRNNPYYCFNPDEQSSGGTEICLPPQSPSLCALCGCRGHLTCSQCKKIHYCCKTHQKEHWKRHKLDCKQQQSSGSGVSVFDSKVAEAVEKQVRSRSLFPEYALEVEEEVFEGKDEEEMKKIMQDANIWEDAVTEGGAEEAADAKLTQADYQRAMGSEVHDPTYINFLTRVERGGRDQVLRYCRMPHHSADSTIAETAGDGKSTDVDTEKVKMGTSSCRSNKGLLLLSSDAELLKKREIALQSNPCPRCGAPRSFECQIMPQLLHFLRVDEQTRLSAPVLPTTTTTTTTTTTSDNIAMDATARDGEVDPPTAVPEGGRAFFNKSDNDIDWGSLDVFTCSASCDTLPSISIGNAAATATATESAYVEELVLLQPPVYKDS